ncbi:hypothetical protein NDU88_004174 [Pleurodeles waltl]|uniref:Uncharacterized protein n=1 Tax=Pleurodeles waltl TaxID=8319 RepID=A0AAV7RFD2_PLEWA|nr:hypothetical protein NDU88_004174 [Pleurodeles waltl]
MAKCRKAQKNRKTRGRRREGKGDGTQKMQALGDTEENQGSAITQHRHSGIQKEKRGARSHSTGTRGYRRKKRGARTQTHGNTDTRGTGSDAGKREGRTGDLDLVAL